jgi:hypothetical protein
MLRLNDPIIGVPTPPVGIELPPLREPESLDMPPSYVSSTGATVRSGWGTTPA